jgi:glycosyltransferase involved in cell wall biosynthesis
MCGGTETQVMTLCRSLEASRFDLELACLRRIGPFVDEINQRRIPLAEYPIDSFRSGKAIAQQVKFARHVAQRGIQIVHSYNFYGNVFAIPPARLAGVPVVIASIRDLGPYLTPRQKRVQRYTCRFADCVLVNADAVKRWLVGEGYDAEQIVVIHNGVDLSRFSDLEPDRIRRQLGLSPGVPLIAVVSRLNRLKGLEQFLEAAVAIGRRHPEARFLVVGETPPYDRPYLDELKQLAERLGIGARVIFTGLRSDVPVLLSAVSVAIMPSLNEALSNALLEAMAAGAAVVATRVGGTPEALIDGETGLLVPPADTVALAAAATHLLEAPDLARRLGLAARQSIERRFSIARMTEATERLYAELLTRKARGFASRRSGEGCVEMDERPQWSERSLL